MLERGSARVRIALSTMSACCENADDSTTNICDMHHLQAFQSTLDRIWISCIVYPNDDEGEEITPNRSFCDRMTEAVDEFFSGYVHHPPREILSGLHNALRIIATSSHSFAPSDEYLSRLCMKIYACCVEILFDKTWMNVEDESRASATREFYHFYCCLSNWSQDRFLVLAILSQKPWGHEIMNQVLAGEENTDRAEVDRYLTLEGKHLLEHRLRVLIHEGLLHHALNLAKACNDHPNLGQEPIFLETLLLLCFNLGLRDELQTQVDDHPSVQHVLKIAKNMGSYCPEHASNLSKLILEQVLLDRHSGNFLIKEAVELWLDTKLKLCSPDSDTFAEGLEEISTLTKDPLYLYNLADHVHMKVGVAATPHVVSLCLKALRVPSLSVTDDIMQAAEIDYGNAAACMLLSEALKDDERVQRLCLLAAFFIAPSLESLSTLKDSYQTAKESQSPRLTSYQQHDLIKCMEYFIPVCVSLSEDWQPVSSVFEGHLRKSKVICITLRVPGGDVKRLKFYDKSWHPSEEDFKQVGVIRVKEALHSVQRCHKDVILLSCRHERQILPKVKKKRPAKQKNSQACLDSSETAAVADDEASPEWLPCVVLDLQQEVLTEQEFIDQASSDTGRKSPVLQTPQPHLEMQAVSLQNRTSDLEDASVVEEGGPNLQQDKSLEMLDGDDVAYSSRDPNTKTFNQESAPQVLLCVGERERKLPIKAQEKQLNKQQVGTRKATVCVKRSDFKSDVTVLPAMLTTLPEHEDSNSTIADSSDSSDTEMSSLIDELSFSSNQSEDEDELPFDDEELEKIKQDWDRGKFVLTGKEEELQILDVNTCQGNLSKYTRDAKHSHESENLESLKLNVSTVVPCSTQDEEMDLEREKPDDGNSVVQSALTDIVKVVLVKDRQATELLLNSNRPCFTKESELDVHNCSPEKENVIDTTHANLDETSLHDQNNKVETCSMSQSEGSNHQHRMSHIKTSVCSVKLTCFMKQRAKKQNPQNLELWRFLVRERDKEKGDGANSHAGGIDIDVKSPEEDSTIFPVDKVNHLAKSTAEILDKQNGKEDMQILAEVACGEIKGHRLASVCTKYRIPWIDDQVVQGEEQSEGGGQFSMTNGSETRPNHRTNTTSATHCSSSNVSGNLDVKVNQPLLGNLEMLLESPRNQVEDQALAGITSFKQGKSLENVPAEEITKFGEHVTEESPILDKPQTCFEDEVRDLELPVLTRETEVNREPVTLEKRETSQSTNDVAMLCVIKDCENSDTPLLLDCYEEKFHDKETNDKYVNCEHEGNTDVICPKDIHGLSRKAFGESVPQRAIGHMEKSLVQGKDFGNNVESLVSSPVEHIHFQQGQAEMKNRVCCTNLPCNKERRTAIDNPHSVVEKCGLILGNRENERVIESCTCGGDIDLNLQDKQFDHLSLEKGSEKVVLTGNMDEQNNQVDVRNMYQNAAVESPGNKLADVCSELIIPFIDGQVAPKEQLEENGQFLMTRESGTRLNQEANVVTSTADLTNSRGNAAVKADRSLFDIQVESIEVPRNNLEDQIRAGCRNLQDKLLENVPHDEMTKSIECSAALSPRHKSEPQTYPITEVRETGLPQLRQETKISNVHVIEEKGEGGQSTFRNDKAMPSAMQDSSQIIENSDIPILLESADKRDDRDARCEHAKSEDLVFIEDDHELTNKAFGVGIDQRAMGHKDRTLLLENERSSKIESSVSSPKITNFKKSVCCITLPCNMDRQAAKEKPHARAEEWKCIPKDLGSKVDSKSCAFKVDMELKKLEKLSDFITAKADKDEQNNKQELHKLCQSVQEEPQEKKLSNGCSEFKIPWIDGQVTIEVQPEADRKYIMPEESGTRPNHEINMTSSVAKCTSSYVGGNPVVKANQPLVQRPKVTVGCPSNRFRELNSPDIAGLHLDQSLENAPYDETTKLAKLKNGGIVSYIQENEPHACHMDEARDVKLPVLTRETEVNKQFLIVKERETGWSMSGNDLPMHDSSHRDDNSVTPVLLDCNKKEFLDITVKEVSHEHALSDDLICGKDINEHSRKTIGVRNDQKTTCSMEKTLVLENERSDGVVPMVSSLMECIHLEQTKTHCKKSVSCVNLACNMDRRTVKENPCSVAKEWQCVSKNTESKGDSEIFTGNVDTELKPLDKHPDNPSLDKCSDTSMTKVNMDTIQNNIQDLQELCQNVREEPQGNKGAYVFSEFGIPWIDRQVTSEEQPALERQYLMTVECGRHPNNGISMPCVGDTHVSSANGDLSIVQPDQLLLEAPELSLQCMNTKMDGPILARMPDLKKSISLEENTINEIRKLTKDLTGETQVQECKLQKHLDGSKELELPLLTQEIDISQEPGIRENENRCDNARNMSINVTKLPTVWNSSQNVDIYITPRIPDGSDAETQESAIQRDIVSKKTEKADDAVSGSVNQRTVYHIEEPSGSDRETSYGLGALICPKAEVITLQQRKSCDMNNKPHACTKDARYLIENEQLNRYSVICACSGKVDRQQQKCISCLSIMKKHVLGEHEADNQSRQVEVGKMAEKNSEKIERKCQGEEKGSLVKRELVSPCLDGKIAPAVQPNENGQYLMLQEDGMSANDRIMHKLNSEVREIVTSVKQESVARDLCKGSCAESCVLKEEEDFLFRESRENVDSDGVLKRPSGQKSSVKESDHQMAPNVKNEGAMLERARLNTLIDSDEDKCNGKAEGDVKRTYKTFLSGNLKNEPVNTSPLFGKRDAMYGVTYSRTSLKQSSMPTCRSFPDQPIRQITSKKSGKQSSERESRMCPARPTNKFISKKSLRDREQMISIRRFACRKSGREEPSPQRDSRKCPVRATNKVISKTSWDPSPHQPASERVTRKTFATSKASGRQSVKSMSLEKKFSSEKSAHNELSHLPLPLKSAAIKRSSSSSRTSVKSSSLTSKKRSCSEASPPPKLMKLSSSRASPAQPSSKPLQKQPASSRKSVRQELQRSCMGVHGVMTRQQIKVESRKKRK